MHLIMLDKCYFSQLYSTINQLKYFSHITALANSNAGKWVKINKQFFM